MKNYLRFKPAYLLLSAIIFFATFATAQVNDRYSFRYTPVTYTKLSSGTLLDSTGADQVWSGINIGFDFKFNCLPYSQLGISSNGFIWFGSNPVSATEYNPIASTEVCDGIVAVYGADLKKTPGKPNYIRYQTTGTAPNRVFTVEWLTACETSNTSNPFDLQIQLHETTGKIELILWDYLYVLTGNNTFGQVGLRGATNADFVNRYVDANNNWCNSRDGRNNTDKCEIVLTFVCNYLAASGSKAIGYTYTPIGCDGNWNIRGKMYHDTDSDCNTTAGEPGIPGVKTKLYDSNNNLLGQGYSLGSGSYYFADNTFGNYTVENDLSGAPYVNLCPSGGVQNVTLSSMNPTSDNNDFRVECATGYDVGVRALYRGPGRLRPGRSATMRYQAGDLSNYYGVHCNTQGLAGEIQITIDGPVQYTGVPVGSPAPSTVSGNTLTWNISDFSQTPLNINGFNLLVDSTANITDSICITITVTALSGTDTEPSNNTYRRCFWVANSFDPNMKEVDLPVVYQAGEWLTYDIHFQNMGNAPAGRVIVIDTLNPLLDISSFEWITASHKAITNVSQDGIVRFGFYDIELPDSASDPAGSKGFIQYRVKMKDNVTPGSTVLSHSEIYFDYNPPIATNMANTVFAVTTGIKDSRDETIAIFPNPANQYATLAYTGDPSAAKMVLSDMAGRVIHTIPLQAQQTNIPLSGLSAGYYLVQLIADNKVVANRKLAVIK